MSTYEEVELAMHFGIVATHGISASVLGEGQIIRAGHPFGELGVDGLSVEGTWQVWGEADEGSGSLHVVATGLIGDERLQDVAYAVGALIAQRIRGGRLLDHVFVSLARDWSAKTHIVTFGAFGYSVHDCYVDRLES